MSLHGLSSARTFQLQHGNIIRESFKFSQQPIFPLTRGPLHIVIGCAIHALSLSNCLSANTQCHNPALLQSSCSHQAAYTHHSSADSICFFASNIFILCPGSMLDAACLLSDTIIIPIFPMFLALRKHIKMGHLHAALIPNSSFTICSFNPLACGHFGGCVILLSGFRVKKNNF